jgi:hypothetical protein
VPWVSSLSRKLHFLKFSNKIGSQIRKNLLWVLFKKVDKKDFHLPKKNKSLKSEALEKIQEGLNTGPEKMYIFKKVEIFQ